MTKKKVSIGKYSSIWIITEKGESRTENKLGGKNERKKWIVCKLSEFIAVLWEQRKRTLCEHAYAHKAFYVWLWAHIMFLCFEKNCESAHLFFFLLVGPNKNKRSTKWYGLKVNVLGKTTETISHLTFDIPLFTSNDCFRTKSLQCRFWLCAFFSFFCCYCCAMSVAVILMDTFSTIYNHFGSLNTLYLSFHWMFRFNFAFM